MRSCGWKFCGCWKIPILASDRVGSPPASSPNGRSPDATERRATSRSSARGEEHGTPADCLSGEPDHAGGPSQPRAGTPQAAAGESRRSYNRWRWRPSTKPGIYAWWKLLPSSAHACAPELTLWRKLKRQRVVRLLVHEILVGRDSVTIRHSIPMPTLTPDSNDGARPTHARSPKPNPGPSYLFALTQSTRLSQCFRRFRTADQLS